MAYYGIYRHNMDGTEQRIARARSETAAHDYAERMNEDWDDPSGAWNDYRAVTE